MIKDTLLSKKYFTLLSSLSLLLSVSASSAQTIDNCQSPSQVQLVQQGVYCSAHATTSQGYMMTEYWKGKCPPQPTTWLLATMNSLNVTCEYNQGVNLSMPNINFQPVGSGWVNGNECSQSIMGCAWTP